MPIYYDKPISLNKEDWLAILADPKITTIKAYKLLQCLLSYPNYTARAGEMCAKYGCTHHITLNSVAGSFGNRIAKAFGIDIPLYYEENRQKWVQWPWNIPFLGEDIGGNHYTWTLRHELAAALLEMLNQE